MVYTPEEYSKKFLVGGCKVSAMTVKRRCLENQLPSNHIPHKLSGGQWIIEVVEEKKEPKKRLLDIY